MSIEGVFKNTGVVIESDFQSNFGLSNPLSE